MNMKSFRLAGRALTALLAALLLMLAPACSSDDNNDGNPEGGNGGNGGNPSTTLTVTPETLTLGSAAGASASVTVTTDAAWTAAPTGEGFTFSPSEGSGNATILVKAAAANEESSEKQLGQITVTAEEVGEPVTVTVTVSQEGNTPEPLPETVVITLDFALGPDITDPALPSKSADALYGRHEYTIDGRMYAIYAEGGNTNNGKFFWNDQSSYEGANIQEPNKALYFSKEGAYIEFPAVDGKTLSKIEYINSTGARNSLPTFDVTTDQGVSLIPSIDIESDNSLLVFFPTEIAVNTRCRLMIENHENAQPAKLVLTYTIPEV